MGLLALIIPHLAAAGETSVGRKSHAKCSGTLRAESTTPTPADPYPLMAAGWGSELGAGRMASRWVEDWSGMAAADRAPALKAITMGDEATLTLSAEARFRQVASDNAQLTRGNSFVQTQLRTVLGADLRLNPNFRFYGELGSGQVDRRRNVAKANFQNDISLQQLFFDARGYAGSTLVGVMLGRQEFSDGPRQLISLSDGPNLHRSWNGVRLYAHGARKRFGAFDLRATRLERGAFDESVNHGEKLQGLNASFIVSPGEGPNTYLEPFWIHSENPAFRSGNRVGLDDRDTLGLRLWGRRGKVRFDWTGARQSGRSIDDRRIDAWGLFAVQSLTLSERGWKPRLTSHIDVASGGGPTRGFNQLYASSNYLGEGQFLSLSNLLMVAPGIALSPTSRTSLSLEYGYARRLDASDFVYAGGMRAYAGTQTGSGHRIGGLTRLSGNWSPTGNLTLSMNFEHLEAGEVLERAGFTAGRQAYVGATYRY
jgi:hypothetical protein